MNECCINGTFFWVTRSRKNHGTGSRVGLQTQSTAAETFYWIQICHRPLPADSHHHFDFIFTVNVYLQGVVKYMLCVLWGLCASADDIIKLSRWIAAIYATKNRVCTDCLKPQPEIFLLQLWHKQSACVCACTQCRQTDRQSQYNYVSSWRKAHLMSSLQTTGHCHWFLESAATLEWKTLLWTAAWPWRNTTGSFSRWSGRNDSAGSVFFFVMSVSKLCCMSVLA